MYIMILFFKQVNILLFLEKDADIQYWGKEYNFANSSNQLTLVGAAVGGSPYASLSLVSYNAVDGSLNGR